MCSNCRAKAEAREAIARRMKIVPVSPPTDLVLPGMCPMLESQGFPPHLLDRLRGFYAWTQREERHHPGLHTEFGVQALILLSHLWSKPFDANRHQLGEPQLATKRRVLDALHGLSGEFGLLMPGFAWDSFAFLATRTNPEEPQSILVLQEHLPHPYWLVDAVLHATGKVYDLMLHIQSSLCRDAGVLLNHGCDCNCALIPAPHGRIEFDLATEDKAERAGSWLSHFLAELFLICEGKLPFEFGLSPAAATVFADSTA